VRERVHTSPTETNNESENIMTTASLINIDQNMQDETTNYWFDVNGESFALSDCNGDVQLLDCDGCPVEDCNDHDGIKQLLLNQNPFDFTK
jgi:hypothetical protein